MQLLQPNSNNNNYVRSSSDFTSLGQTAVQLTRNLCFALFVVGVVAFTLLAATYQPTDSLLLRSSKLTSFLTSTAANSTFTANADDNILLSQLDNAVDCNGDIEKPIQCTDLEVFHTMMQAAIETFKDVHFYRFGKAVDGAGDGRSCDMAWRFQFNNATGNGGGFNKDYRRFVVARTADCSYVVRSIGKYHTGVNARKRKKGKSKDSTGVEDAVNDSLPVVESEGKFSTGKYLVYLGGGDRCKSMHHYIWSLLCALGEAQFLNRTFVMDLSICLSSNYARSKQDEEGKDFRFYFDFSHLKDSASIVDQQQFWKNWELWEKKNRLSLYLVEDFRISPKKLSVLKDSVILRKFGNVEPDNYWYRVCEGESESVIRRPWKFLRKSPRLMDIVSGIASKMNWDFDAVHIVRGEKAKNTQLWPNLAADTSPKTLLSTLKERIDGGRNLYIATNDPVTPFFDPLKDKYVTHFLDDYKALWDENSEWYLETQKLNNGIPVEFDGYMKSIVDTEVFLRAKKKLETFNDLTKDCRDGINTCNNAS